MSFWEAFAIGVFGGSAVALVEWLVAWLVVRRPPTTPPAAPRRADPTRRYLPPGEWRERQE